jgi:hypothetical protein
MATDEIGLFVRPARVFSRTEVLSRPSPVPSEGGVYGWWFRRLPPLVVAPNCGQPSSKQSLLERIRYHYTGNAEGSTLRKTLGCLLAGELGIELRRVGSGKRMTFVGGEHALSAWMGENAYVSWIACQRPWELEDSLITALDLPLNLMGNKHNQFHSVLAQVRARCVARARDLPVLPNPGVGGR